MHAAVVVLGVSALLVALEDPAASLLRSSLFQAAPGIDAPTWLGTDPSKTGSKVVSDASGRNSRRARKLSELRDHVVLVHATPLADADTAERALALVRDLVAANQDRRIAAIGFLGAPDATAAQDFAQRVGLDHPLALAAGPSPYADLDAHPAGCVHVIGRGGGVLWHGDAARDTKAFLESVDRALAAPDVPPLERRLDARLEKALEEYWSGRFAKAASLAQSVERAAAKSEDAAAERDAQLLQQAVTDAEVAWMRELRASAVRQDATAWLAQARAVAAAFPRSAASKEADRMEKDLKKEGGFASRLRDAGIWLDLCADRPVLFPERKDAAGDRFADKLASYVRSTSNSTEETRTARALLERYGAAGR